MATLNVVMGQIPTNLVRLNYDYEFDGDWMASITEAFSEQSRPFGRLCVLANDESEENSSLRGLLRMIFS